MKKIQLIMPVTDPGFDGCDSAKPRVKCRHSVVLMGFAAGLFFYGHGITMNVGLEAMLNHSAIAIDPMQEITPIACPNLVENSSRDDRESYEKAEGEFLWEGDLQSYILGSSFVCYAIATIPAGKLTESIGCKRVLFWATFFPSISTFLTPLAAWCGVNAVIFVQSLSGVAQAGILPAQSLLIANWCPKEERGFYFTLMLTGTAWGAVIMNFVVRFLCWSTLFGGWPSAFYVTGGTGIATSLMIGYFLFDNPRFHPSITKEELEYIAIGQESFLTRKTPGAPMGKIFSCVPIYALGFAHFGQVWAISFFFTVMPLYFETILFFSMEQSGLFSSLPFLLQAATSLAAARLSIVFIKKNYMDADKAQKLWTLMSCSGFSICLLGMFFAGCNRSVSLGFCILSLSCTGFSFAGCWITPADMSPTYAGFVSGMTYFIGLTANLILNVVVRTLTSERQTMELWNKIMFITIGVVVSSGMVFAIFGSAKVQPWNYTREKPKNDKTELPTSQKKLSKKKTDSRSQKLLSNSK